MHAVRRPGKNKNSSAFRKNSFYSFFKKAASVNRRSPEAVKS